MNQNIKVFKTKRVKLKNIYGFKSPFGHPTVLIKEHSKILFVQDYNVAEVTETNATINVMYTDDMYKNTKEFFLQEGYKAESVHQMDRDYIKVKTKGKRR